MAKWSTGPFVTCATTRLIPPHGDALGPGPECGRSPVVGVVVTTMSALLVCERCAAHWRESKFHVEPVDVPTLTPEATA